MENKRLWLTILVMALIFGMTVVGCENDIKDEIDARLNGKWFTNITGTISICIDHLPPEYIALINQFPEIDEFPNFIVNRETGMAEMEIEYKMELELDNGKYEYRDSSKGTYTTNNGKITMRTTHVCFAYASIIDSEAIVPEYKWYTKNELKTVSKNGDSNMGDIEVEYFTEEEINNMFSEETFNYSVNGSTLILNNNGEITIYNKDSIRQVVN
jgi:hypothetical protein